MFFTSLHNSHADAHFVRSSTPTHSPFTPRKQAQFAWCCGGCCLFCSFIFTTPPPCSHSHLFFSCSSFSHSLFRVRLQTPWSYSHTTQKIARQTTKLLATAAQPSVHSGEAPQLRDALDACIIFAQETAGSAVFIHADGWILTCAHCIAENTADWNLVKEKLHWLLLSSGLAVQAKCLAWDDQRDLALLKVVAMEANGSVQCPPGGCGAVRFPFAVLASEMPPTSAPLLCIGQPSSYDLETASQRTRTNYSVLEASVGTFRGLVPDLNPQDNRELGAMMHNAWTYWGHSGAPLLLLANGTLIGIHSSWDEDNVDPTLQSGMRHGVPLVAIRKFLDAHLPSSSSSTSTPTANIETHVEKTTAQLSSGSKRKSPNPTSSSAQGVSSNKTNKKPKPAKP